jgi:hypothetical protein
MEHRKYFGDQTALAGMLALHESRIPFLLPLAENTLFDLGIELDGRRLRVHCKSGRLWGRARNNQHRRIRYAADYEIAKVSVVAA